MSNYTKTIEALKNRNNNDWELADALVKEVRPSRRGRHNGAADEWEALAAELEKEGISFSIGTLRIYRDVAAHWRKEQRFDDVSFSAHRHALPADDPVAVLDRLIKANNGKAPTVKQVKQAVSTSTSTSQVDDAFLETLRSLRKGVEGVDKTFEKKLRLAVARDAKRLAELEALVAEMPKVWGKLQDAMPKQTKQTQKTQSAKTSHDPKKRASQKTQSAQTVGRTRGGRSKKTAAKE